MKNVLLAAVLGAAVVAAGVPAARVSAQSSDREMSLGSVHLLKKVMVDGKPLDAGTYQLRLTSDKPQVAVGESPDSEQYVEFLKAGKVVARDVATVVAKADIASIAKGETPPPQGTAKVELLKGNDYIRVWLNKGGTHYLLHLPVAS